MSSPRSLSGSQDTLPFVDERLTAVINATESLEGGSESGPESDANGVSTDEATQHRSFLSDSLLASLGKRFLVATEVRVPSACDRACYPLRGYQYMYHDALETGLRLPLHPFFVSVLNEFGISLG